MGAAPAARGGLTVPSGDEGLQQLIHSIVAGDQGSVELLLAAKPELATAALGTGASRQTAADHFLEAIAHYVYAGDTALHVAAAAHSADLVVLLVAAGSEVSAANRRGAQPLHYAVDGGPNGARWDPPAQGETIVRLLDAGADPNATDSGGTTPLHRAIRNRCATAVEVLLGRGADPMLPNGRGSTAWQLATWTTGKGGSGSDAAKEQQAQILRLLETASAATG